MATIAVYATLTGSKKGLKYVFPNVFLGLFFLIYLIKYKFGAKVLERIAVIIQDGIIIATLNIFAWKYTYITDNHLDFYALAVVLAIELIECLIKFVLFCKHGGENDGAEDAIAPEKEDRGANRGRVNNSFSNSVQQINPEYSYDGLKNSGVGSPKRRR